MSEYDEQKAFVSYLKYMRLFHYATNNENNTYKQNRRYAMIAEQKAKAVGKKKGVTDLTILLDNGIVYIEMKRRPSVNTKGGLSYNGIKTSKEQVAFLEEVNNFEYAIGFVAYGVKDAIKKLNDVIISRDLREAKALIRINYGNALAIKDSGKKFIKDIK